MTTSIPTPTPTAAEKRERLISATYTVAELSVLLDCSERHIHRLRDKKAIPGELRVGKCVRFARHVIDSWLSCGTVPTTR